MGCCLQHKPKIHHPNCFYLTYKKSRKAVVKFSLRCHQYVNFSFKSTYQGIKLISDRVNLNLSYYHSGIIIRTKARKFVSKKQTLVKLANGKVEEGINDSLSTASSHIFDEM